MYVIGDLALFIAVAATVMSLVLFALAWYGRDQLVTLARSGYMVASGAIIIAIGSLMYLILTHDFSVGYVYSYSSTDLPFGYLVSTLWGGQEGTFLLWALFTSVLGLILMRTADDFENGTMFFVNLFILSLLIIMLKKSPFELMAVAQTEGAGLNPLLQNFWMQIHPPIMFIGFSGAVFPFAFALTALVSRKYNTWADAARRWTLFAWSALGISLVMGGYWAYVTLGWGGFWAWDPVENSSLIPWIFLTAQIHSLFIKRQRRGLMRFSLFVVCLSFWSVLYGTFLTRSGVLANFSVHSFVDLGLNQFLVGGLITFVALGVGLLAFRWQDIRPDPSFSTVTSRAYLVTVGVLVLFVGGVLTLLGTSAPLLTRLTSEPSNVGLPYYFTTMTPIAIFILALLAVFPALKWNHGVARPRLLMMSASGFVLTISGLLLFDVTSQLIYLLYFGCAGGAFVINSEVVIRKIRLSRKLSAPYLAHVGLTITLVGAAASAGFETKQQVNLVQGTELPALGQNLRFTEIIERADGFDCHVEVRSDDGYQFTAVLPHEFPRNAEGVMRKPHVEKFLAYDLYLAPAAFQPAEQESTGLITLAKGESATVEGYKFTFDSFDVAAHEEAGVPTVGANLTVACYGKTEKVQPILAIFEQDIERTGALFDDGKGTVYIDNVRPEDGSVVLKVVGEFLPVLDTKNAILILELSRKPLINLFWFGTIIMFFAGGLSMVRREKKLIPPDFTSEQKFDNTESNTVAVLKTN